MTPEPVTLTPIGRVLSPYREKHDAPRQAAVADVEARIELGREYADALDGLAAFSHLWVLAHLDRAVGWKPRVRPPRSAVKRGVFATRAPRRPNALGLSLTRLLSIDGTVLHVRGLDLLDGTPVLDLKPHVSYADSAPDASAGWLGEAAAADPGPRYTVAFAPRAEAQLGWLLAHGGPDLRAPVTHTLSLGPTPHAYRRIKQTSDGYRLAHRDFRLDFGIDGTRVTVHGIASGYRPSVLADAGALPGADTPLSVHRAFAAAFPAPVSE